MRIFLPLALVGCAATGPADIQDDTDTDVANDDGCTVGLEVGDCAPDFTLRASDGTSYTLSERGGERVILVGSATW